MKCRYCKRDGLPPDAAFCCWCGERLKKEKRRDIKIPEPRQLPSGRWIITLRKEGLSFTRDTAEECRTEAMAIRMGLIEKSKQPEKITLSELLDEYIESKSNVLSPSTVAGYRRIAEHRFTAFNLRPVGDIDWQVAVNAEAASCSAKTLKNAWGLIASALKSRGLSVPSVTLPQVVRKTRPYLEPEQVPDFVAAVKDSDVAVPALLALSSLRRSEIYALTWDDIEPDVVHVRGSAVKDENNNLVFRAENKNSSSRRDVPIFIPELKELLSKRIGDKPCTVPYGSIDKRINAVCEKVGLPRVGLHGLRHSFASLAYSQGLNEMTTMKIGGWADNSTMRRVYTHLANRDIIKGVQALSDFFEK